MALTLSKAGVPSVTFPRGRAVPTTVNEQVNQLIEVAEDGSPQVTELGATVQEYQVELLSVDATTEQTFRNFFEDSRVRWALNTVTLTDEAAVAVTGRYWGPFPYVRQEYAAGLFRIAFTFRVET